MLVAGHLVELYDSDSPIGGRYYFEGFFGIALLAAAGWRQLIRDCNWDGWFRNALAGALCIVAAANLLLFTHWEFTLRWPTRQLAKAVYDAPQPCTLVFLVATQDFIPHRYNLNHPRSEALYLLDLDPNQRGRIAMELGKHCWATLAYDPIGKDALWNLHSIAMNGTASAPAMP